MKSVLEYLNERKNMTFHNLYYSSANYAMTIPKMGEEEKFAEYTRDCEIVDELIAMVKANKAKLIIGIDVGRPGGDYTAISVILPSEPGAFNIDKICESVAKKVREAVANMQLHTDEYYKEYIDVEGSDVIRRRRSI